MVSGFVTTFWHWWAFGVFGSDMVLDFTVPDDDIG